MSEKRRLYERGLGAALLVIGVLLLLPAFGMLAAPHQTLGVSMDSKALSDLVFVVAVAGVVVLLSAASLLRRP